MKNHRIEGVRRQMGYQMGFDVPHSGMAGTTGGLSLWWNDNMEINVLSSSKNLIHTKMQERARLIVEFMDRMELIDLGFSGPKFARQGTRNNSLVQERLDRGLVNGVWQERWPSSSIAHGTVWASDLSPLIVMNESKSWNSRVDGQWMNKWKTKIHSTKKNLKSWSQETFKGRRNEIQALTAHLAILDKWGTGSGPVNDNEIMDAIYQMGGLNATGPDGF
ncbi:hypothetical protein ACFX15_021853 [Malus domestica]